MPITSSAKKAVRVSVRRHLENLVVKDRYKSALKVARKLNSDAKAEEINSKISEAQSSLGKAVKSKLLHRNTAKRLLSRLVKHVTAGQKPVKATQRKNKVATKSSARSKNTKTTKR